MNDNLCINTLRMLALNMIDKANSGHPGMALDAAPIMHTLFSKHIIATALKPDWIKRDRFVLSSGHVSSLLYATLHLCGYDLSLDDLKSFRQYKSKTPGHPEYKLTEGVDISTGPLGQGIANAVGMAMAEAHLTAMHKNISSLLSHYTYVLCGDGDLEEGVALEAMSLAGRYKLNKLIIIYDNNDVTLDGPLSQSSCDNTSLKAKSMGFDVIEVSDGNDVEAIDTAINEAKKSEEKPTLIIVKNIIGYGSKNQGTCKVHGSPLTPEGTAVVKEFLKWPYSEDFYVPEEVRNEYRNNFIARGLQNYMDFNDEVSMLQPELKAELESVLNIEIESKIHGKLPLYIENYSNGTRRVSGELLNVYQDNCDNLFGGSADVAGSVITSLKNHPTFEANNYEGRNINYGIREHAMCAIANGIAAHGGLMPYVGSFLVFSDYARGALRCAALMGLPVTYLFSHDSIAVGEDGPTHEPIEHLESLRAIPNFNVVRPCDANETEGAYEVAFNPNNNFPTAIILSRQNLKTIRGCSKNKVRKGAYVISYEKEHLDCVLLATGSEVNLASEAANILAHDGIDCRVVSMPSNFLFEKQNEKYRKSVLPDGVKVLAIEMGRGDAWYKYADDVMSIETFGLSAPAAKVIEHFGFTPANVVKRVKELLGK